MYQRRNTLNYLQAGLAELKQNYYAGEICMTGLWGKGSVHLTQIYAQYDAHYVK